jgi:hypothetical protein
MVSVVKRPQGHKLIDQAIAATIIDGGAYAFVIFPYHGLSDGDVVYISSDVDEYNGFWYVTVQDYETFTLSETEDGEFIEFYQEVDIDYYQTQPHDWSSIFLPIVYKLENTRWPSNTVDTGRSVSSQADDNGFTHLVLSGDIKVGEVNALEFVYINHPTDSTLNGIWQIVEVIASDQIVLNLPYHSANSFIGATVQYYYNNYQVKVKIYAGLDPLHPWAYKKPYEEVAQLSLTPDEDGQVMFSVSDYIKSKVAVKNNLLLYSLPLNLDAFTGFYISFTESYDASDSYTLYTAQGAFENDTFEGYAIAGKLPFKNVYSGDYADYVLTSGSPARWLTGMSRLLAVTDRYFDISFIKNIRGAFWIIIDKYVADYLMNTEVVSYADSGIGVYRIPITPNANYDSFCVRAYTPGVAASEGVPVTTLEALTGFANFGGAGWSLGAAPTISVNGNGGVSGWLAGDIVTTNGYSYEFTVELEVGVTGSSAPISEVIYALLTVTGIVLDAVTYNYTTAGVKTETFTLMATGAGQYLAVYITNNTAFDTKNYTLNDATYNAPGAPPDDSLPAQTMTEEICIDILDVCDIEGGFTPEDVRLLEDGDYRLLE